MAVARSTSTSNIALANIALAMAPMLVLLACSGVEGDHQEASAESGGAAATATSLSLALQSQTDEQLTLSVEFVLGADQPGPRMVEAFLALGPGLALDHAEALDALTRAGKQLVAQATEDGQVRLIMFTTGNVVTLDSGPLARVTLRRTGKGATSVAIANKRPLFAPVEADRVVRLGAPLTIGGE